MHARLCRGPSGVTTPSWSFTIEYGEDTLPPGEPINHTVPDGRLNLDYTGTPANFLRLEYVRCDGGELTDVDIALLRQGFPDPQAPVPQPSDRWRPWWTPRFWPSACEAIRSAFHLGIDVYVMETLKYDPEVVRALVDAQGMPPWLVGTPPHIPPPYEVHDPMTGERLSKPHDEISCRCSPCRKYLDAETLFYVDVAHRELPDGTRDELDALTYVLLYRAWFPR